jgi:hypothetical protein
LIIKKREYSYGLIGENGNIEIVKGWTNGNGY